MNIRPKSIIVFSFVYLVSPLLILVQAAIVNLVPLVGPGNIFTRLKFFDFVVLAVYLLCAVSIFSVRKWGWWAFIMSSCFLVARNIIVFSTNPFTSLLLVILYNVLLTFAAAFFFRRHLIAPYFNPRLRIWEQSERYQLEINVIVDEPGHPAELIDISAGGCFLRVSGILPQKDNYSMIIICQTMQIALQAKLIRRVHFGNGIYGYGLMFYMATKTAKTGLDTLLAMFSRAGLVSGAVNGNGCDMRNSVRFQTNFSTALVIGNLEISGHIRNISRSGCCLELLIQGPDEQECTFLSSVSGKRIICDAEVVWKNIISDAWVYGVIFRNLDRPTRKKLRLLIKTVKILRAEKRSWDRDERNKMIDSTLPYTPYKAILLMKNSFSRN
ncbi:MAG: PilZ domain-containing protein [Spirochaetales bacterium]|nr:PilZ domain-containing protein [Spirochaetales bacterium]